MKKQLVFAVAGAALLTLSACTQTDVVAKFAATSFTEVTKVADIESDDAFKGWTLIAPDQSATFLFSYDFSVSAPHDVMLKTDVQPFIDAGLDVTKLPAGTIVDGMIMVGQSLGETKFSADASKTADASMKELIRVSRSTLGYHEAMGHYGIDLGNGNKFEWAKDLSTNDKDIVFILDPQQFIDAGVDVENIEGWVYGTVKVMDENDNEIEVQKLLKPFNLK